jgi:hypothetical protein
MPNARISLTQITLISQIDADYLLRLIYEIRHDSR